MKALANLCFEAGMLKKQRRTGYPFLGSGGESIADHCLRAALIGYWLGTITPGVDAGRVALMMIHHDLPEARTGDLNYVNKRYNACHEDKAIDHALRGLPPGLAEAMHGLLDEFNHADSPEAALARDADQLDFLVELKEQKDLGNPYAEKWIGYALKRLKTEAGQALAQGILDTDWTDWWFEKREELWTRSGNGYRPE